MASIPSPTPLATPLTPFPKLDASASLKSAKSEESLKTVVSSSLSGSQSLNESPSLEERVAVISKVKEIPHESSFVYNGTRYKLTLMLPEDAKTTEEVRDKAIKDFKELLLNTLQTAGIPSADRIECIPTDDGEKMNIRTFNGKDTANREIGGPAAKALATSLRSGTIADMAKVFTTHQPSQSPKASDVSTKDVVIDQIKWGQTEISVKSGNILNCKDCILVNFTNVDLKCPTPIYRALNNDPSFLAALAEARSKKRQSSIFNRLVNFQGDFDGQGEIGLSLGGKKLSERGIHTIVHVAHFYSETFGIRFNSNVSDPGEYTKQATKAALEKAAKDASYRGHIALALPEFSDRNVHEAQRTGIVYKAMVEAAKEYAEKHGTRGSTIEIVMTPGQQQCLGLTPLPVVDTAESDEIESSAAESPRDSEGTDAGSEHGSLSSFNFSILRESGTDDLEDSRSLSDPGERSITPSPR